MHLEYIGKNLNRRVNGRPMHTGDKITDPQEVKDLKDHPDFKQIGVVTSEKAKNDKAAKVSKASSQADGSNQGDKKVSK